MKYIGAHVSVTKSIDEAPREANMLGATAFAFNLINPMRWSTPQYTAAEIESFKNECKRYSYTPAQILPHSAFVINLGSPDARKLSLSRKTFIDEMKRCMQLGLTMLNFHPGSHLKQISEEDSLRLVAESINIALDATSGVCAVIENTAGQGSNLGYSFDQIAAIIDGVHDKERVGVCIDTCHASAAGYDMTTMEGFNTTWNDFDRIIGFNYLKGMHINDAMKETGSRIDRHASVGKGTLGIDFFECLMKDARFDGIPLILETPDTSLWEQEIKTLQALSIDS